MQHDSPLEKMIEIAHENLQASMIGFTGQEKGDCSCLEELQLRLQRPF